MMKRIRTILVDGDSAFVPLTRGFVAAVDTCDLPIVGRFNWTASVKLRADGSLFSVYAYRAEKRDGERRVVLMHRAIAGTPDGLWTDHIDGDGLNNRRANLRHATTAQNARNQRLRTNNLSGVKGVGWIAQLGKWRAQIMVNGRNFHLGLFGTIDAAADAYAIASERLHGSFGRTA